MKRKIFSILLCLAMAPSMLPTFALADDPIETRLMLPEDKKLVGYNQESDKAWVLENLSESDYRYTYIERLKNNNGYTERELLYLYPATNLSADIIYYTDEDMTQKTTVADHGATAEGGVPNVAGAYYRKAVFAGGTDDKGDADPANDVTYPAKEASSPFYVVDELAGGTRRGFSLSLVQPNVTTQNGLPRGADEPVASVDEGWSWTPAGISTPAKLTLQNFREEMRWMGVPIAQRAAAFTKTDTTATSDPAFAKRISLINSLFKKIQERGGGLILPGYEQVEIELGGTNQIGTGTFSSDGAFSGEAGAYGERAGIYVFNFEAADLSTLLGKLAPDGSGQFTPNPKINILGMEDKSLSLTGSGTLNVASDVRSPAGISVGSNVTLNVAGSVQTRLFYYDNLSTRNDPESVLSTNTYTGSAASPADVAVSIQGRVNIRYGGTYGIYSTGKLSADGAALTVTQTSGNSSKLGETAGLGAAYGVEIENSNVTVSGSGSAGGAVSAAERLSVTGSTLIASGYDYGLSAFGVYANNDLPASLLLSGGNTAITAGKAAVYASDAAVSQAAVNTDGVDISLQNIFGTLSGGNYAVYAYTQKADAPVRGVSFSASPSANTVTPYGVTAGTVPDSAKTVATLLTGPGSGTAAGVVSAYFTHPGDFPGSDLPNDDPVPTEPPKPTEISFTDVDKDAWYYNAVQYVAQKKLLIGVTDSEFAPELPMTRSMMVVLLYRMAGEPAVSGTVSFHDADTSGHYANALIWAYQNGIVNGVADGLFAPDSNITRQQLAVFLYRYVNPPSGSTDILSSFTDADSVSDYAVYAMTWAVRNGIFQGDGQKQLNPNAPATRAQCAAILQRYLQLHEDSKSPS